MYSIILVSVLFSFVFALAAVADLPPSESINHATSHAANVSKSTGAAKAVYKTVKSVNGHNYTIITSRGGPGFTLAPSGVGVSTSVFGSVYRIATPTSSDSATSSAPATSSATSPHLIIVAIVIGLVIFIIGGWICVLKHKKKRRKQAKDAADAAAKAKAARPAPEKYPYSGYPEPEYYRDYRSRQY